MAIYSEFFPLKMVIFHSYVKLPEGTSNVVNPVIPSGKRKSSKSELQNSPSQEQSIRAVAVQTCNN